MSFAFVTVWLIVGMVAVIAVGFLSGPGAMAAFIVGGLWVLVYGLHVTRPARVLPDIPVGLVDRLEEGIAWFDLLDEWIDELAAQGDPRFVDHVDRVGTAGSPARTEVQDWVRSLIVLASGRPADVPAAIQRLAEPWADNRETAT